MPFSPLAGRRWRQPDEGQRHAPAILSSFLDQLTKAHEYLRNDIRNAISLACAQHPTIRVSQPSMASSATASSSPRVAPSRARIDMPF
ncbi:hypothetical protein ELG88_00560 [Rhizobium leguminosarum]|nr:hypothetical protein ELG88_00560 [Rhizobium leguminosarum]TBH09769.1 hypothetical protein ELG68_00570 [Rhizobium leguminosarum]TBH34522.1 hypothetical protein ELG66_00570 [Rhizobium leguminosarum]